MRPLVLKLSATGHTTDRILAWMEALGAAGVPDERLREMDRAPATGEDLAASLFAAALGASCHVITDVDAVYARDPRMDVLLRVYSFRAPLLGASGTRVHTPGSGVRELTGPREGRRAPDRSRPPGAALHRALELILSAATRPRAAPAQDVAPPRRPC